MTTASEPDAVVRGAVSALDQITAALEKQYTRLAHRGRLEQVGAVAETLKSLISQLPDEEAREADYTARVLKDYDAGLIKVPGDPEATKETLAHPQAVFERLAEALAQREGSAA
jgi:hypothetical protein